MEEKKEEIEPVSAGKQRKSRKERQAEKMKTSPGQIGFDVLNDPDYPPEAVNSNIIVEEIEMNGRMQRVFKKTYYLIDGKTINVTRME